METLKDMSDIAPIFVTLPNAEGSIEPKPEQQKRLEEITERLADGEFHAETFANVPVICIDGRYGGFNLLPNAAGGSETLMVADDLTFKKYAGDGSTNAAFEKVLEKLISEGHMVGGHTDDHHGEGASGCGANDKLNLIYDFLVRKGDAIRDTAAALGVEVSDELHQHMVAQAGARTEFSSGDQLLETLESKGENAVVEPLVGSHNEVVAVINTRANTTLDRRALQTEYGDEYQAFNVDVWAFEAGARALTDDEAEVHALVAAMVYYNLAVAHVLGGQNLRVVVLK